MKCAHAYSKLVFGAKALVPVGKKKTNFIAPFFETCQCTRVGRKTCILHVPGVKRLKE